VESLYSRVVLSLWSFTETFTFTLPQQISSCFTGYQHFETSFIVMKAFLTESDTFFLHLFLVVPIL